jgi:hypothetical protein
MAAYTTIDDPSAYFQIAVYDGTGGLNLPHAVTNDGNSDLQPDLLWIKDRGAGYSHALFDSNRGRAKVIYPDGSNAEASSGTNDDLVSFDTDGFSVGAPSNANSTNGGTTSKVAYQWKANGGTTSSNTDGDLTSTVQFNSTSKFSIITYTGKNPIEPLDIGHGMGEAPDVVIVKNRDRSITWGVYHKDLTAPAQNRYISLSSDIAESANSTVWRNEAPTTSIIKTGESAILNQPNEKIVMYAWKSVQGFSKFGKYVGNGDANGNGAFIFTGFKPALVIIKVISNSGYQWWLTDNKRNPHNEMDKWLFPDLSNAEYNGAGASKDIDFLSNGFKLRASDDGFNGSGKTYVYFAWAENPFVTSTGIPTTAR